MPANRNGLARRERHGAARFPARAVIVFLKIGNQKRAAVNFVGFQDHDRNAGPVFNLRFFGQYAEAAGADDIGSFRRFFGGCEDFRQMIAVPGSRKKKDMGTFFKIGFGKGVKTRPACCGGRIVDPGKCRSDANHGSILPSDVKDARKFESL